MDDQRRTGGSLRQIASLEKASVEQTYLTNPALCDHTVCILQEYILRRNLTHNKPTFLRLLFFHKEKCPATAYDMDLLIAATALHHNLTGVTHNPQILSAFLTFHAIAHNQIPVAD
jgi:hypothetical protein